MIRQREPEAGVAESVELQRLCDQLGRVEAPFDEIARSRAEARLGAELAREPARRQRRALGWAAALVMVGAAAAFALAARTVVPGTRSPVAGGPAPLLRFEPYVVAPNAVAPAAGAAAALAVPEALVQPSSRLDVPAGWMLRASLGDAIAITLTGPARAWSERAAENAADNAADNRRTVVHLEQGRLLASLEGGTGRRLEIVSPGAVTDVVGTLFSVEVVGDASRVAVAHGRVQVSAAPGSSGAPPHAPRELAAGQSWLTTLPEPDGLEPALAESLADHERTPAPRGATVGLSITEAPAGAGVWVGTRRIASAPAWVLVEPRAAVRLSAPARAAVAPTEPSYPSYPPWPPSPSTEPSPPVSEPPARATRPARPRLLLTPSSAAPTERSPLDPAPLAPEEVTARTLFHQADAARAAGDTRLALNTLRALVERFPRDPATAAARYELALMEQAAADGEAALRDLAAVDSPSLEDPTHYLRCRVLAKRGAGQAGEAERCLADFRRRFPASAHDADALATETALALARGGCPAAQALLAELERRHPAHRSAARLRAACRRGP
jgi:ferric-dicitrate binding protein FerR (iron transport regulator)/TolA-binding protein